jgi:hypothetical protein
MTESLCVDRPTPPLNQEKWGQSPNFYPRQGRVGVIVHHWGEYYFYDLRSQGGVVIRGRRSQKSEVRVR